MNYKTLMVPLLPVYVSTGRARANCSAPRRTLNAQNACPYSQCDCTAAFLLSPFSFLRSAFLAC